MTAGGTQGLLRGCLRSPEAEQDPSQAAGHRLAGCAPVWSTGQPSWHHSAALPWLWKQGNHQLNSLVIVKT